MERLLRRQQDTLVAMGTGVIAFGTWSVARSIVYFVTGVREIQTTFPARLTDSVAIAVLYALLVALLTFDLGLRFYVGLSARAEGKGKRGGKLYLVITVLLIASYLYTIPQDILVFSRGRETFLDTIASLFIDLTSLITLVWLLIAAIRSRRLTDAEEVRA